MNEFRHQPLYDAWVVIAPNRVKKPGFEPGSPPPPAINDPFIPGQEHKTPPEIYAIRENGKIAASWKTRVFANKFPLLALEAPAQKQKRGFYSTLGGFGAHEMIVDHPKASKHLCRFSAQTLKDLMLTFRDRIAALHQDSRIASVLAFKNQGMKAGNTIPHSHAQIVALPMIAPQLKIQIDQSRDHYRRTGRCLLCDTIQSEEEDKSRILMRNRHFVAFAPFAPRFEFEVWVAPLTHESQFAHLGREALEDLGEILEWALTRLGVALEKPDMNLVLFTAPPERDHAQADYFHHLGHFFHWHIELLPRFEGRDGFELSSGCYVNPVAPEDYAAYLRELDLQDSTKERP
ncbi:MAG: DUF4931 domain-containing protein [Campylobacterales bacterium]